MDNTMISMPNPIMTASLLEDWEDSLTSQDSELWEENNDRCADFCNASPEEAQAFMDELADNGRTTAERFQDAMWYATSTYRAEAEFVQHIFEEIDCQELSPYLVIDWQAMWDRNYCHDFFTVKNKDITFFFHNNF